MHVAVVGCGYVGGVSAACFAELGHTVDCIDLDGERIETYRKGGSPIYEPGLVDLIKRGLDSGRLRFHDHYPSTLDSRIVFIAVNTPGSAEGAADLRAVRDAVTSIAPLLQPPAIIVNKSTVPIGTGDLVQGMAERAGREPIFVVSNPEFLREGSAVADFLRPDRIVLGSSSSWAMDRVAELYAPLKAEIMRVDIRTAEMIKYASNAFLATKISFINEIALICEALEADVTEVARGMGMDRRIGPQFLSAGLGWGGSCFPKDVRALAHMASARGAHPQLLRSVIDINSGQRLRAIARLRTALRGLEGRKVLILGAAFKADTDDTRNSPALELAHLLCLEGCRVSIADPVVRPETIRAEVPQAEYAPCIEEGAKGADAIVLATDWSEYLRFDYGTVAASLSHPLFFDLRNAIEPAVLRNMGFTYLCVGRPGQEGSPLARRKPGRQPALAAGGT